MVSIIKQKVGNRVYYYLTHHNNSRIKRKYLGKKIPKNIGEQKKAFLLEFCREQWHPLLERIQQRFIDNRKKMPRSVVEQELEDFAIVFTYDTQKIEGSRLTRLDTVKLLRDGITPYNKSRTDMVETELAEQVFFDMLNHTRQISLDTIRYWHTKMFNKTKIDLAGQIRDYDVNVHGSKAKFPSGEEVYPLLQDFFLWYRNTKFKINRVELAALAHLKFESIHPFGDGNGRIGRLIMNCILDESKYPMLNIQYAQRISYYKALERSNLANEEVPFLRWFIKTYINANKRWL